MSLQHAQGLAERGMPVFRLKRGTKSEIVDKRWAKGDATLDPVEIFDRFKDGQYNIGVFTSAFVVLDVDRKNGRDGFAELAALEAIHGKLPKTYAQRTPSGGMHYFFDAAGEAYGQRNLSPGIDVRATGGYALGAGSEFDGKEYTVEVDAPRAPLPDWMRLLLIQAPTKGLNAGKIVGEIDTDAAIAAATVYLKGSAKPSIQGAGGDLNAVIVANQVLDRGVSPTTCLELMSEHWNGRCSPPWEYEDLERKVDSAVASQQKAIGSDNPIDGFTAIVLDFPALVPAKAASLFIEDEPDDVTVDWLVDDTITMGGVGFLAGASSSGKTFIAIDLAQSLWRGTPWFGRKILKPGGTFVIAAEGSSSIGLRLKASGHFRYGEDLANAKRGPFACEKGAPPLRTKAERDAFTDKLKHYDAEMRSRFGVPLRLIVIDTFTQTFDVRDENAAADIADRIKIMKAMSNCLPEPPAVIATHHFGKYKEGMRGSGVLRDNSDHVLEVQKDGVLYLEKTKESEAGPIGCFEMPKVTVQYRAVDGKGITSRYVRQVSQPAAVTNARTGLDPAFTEAFQACAKERNGAMVASRDDMRVAMYQWWPNEKTPTKRSNFNRELKKATAAGFRVDLKWICER